MKTLPNFFIVGAARSGTTSLDRYLSQHPEIYVTPRKETHFFAVDDFPPSFKGPGDEKLNKSLIRDEEQYTQLFAAANGAKAIGESSVFYLAFPATAERIARAIPHAKIIIILREPAARAYSAYTYMVSEGRETLGFEEALAQEEVRKRQDWEPIWWYKELSLYHAQVKHYLDIFGPQQVKVLLYDDLLTHAEQMLREVFAFLEVQEGVPIDTSVRHNPSGIPRSRKLYTLLDNFLSNSGPVVERLKSLVPSHLRTALAGKALGLLTRPVSAPNPLPEDQLKGYFAEDVSRLEDLLQRDLHGWHYFKSAK